MLLAAVALSPAQYADVAPENLKDEDVADRKASLLEGMREKPRAKKDEDAEER
jgi:hypothetical protein